MTSPIELRRLLRDLEQELTRTLRINLAQSGLSVDEWALINMLGDGKGHAMSEVSEATGVPSPTATRMVDKLISQALLHRATDQGDRRRVLVALSPKGKELHRRVAPAQDQIADLITARVGLAGLADLAARLSATVAALRGDAESADMLQTH